MSFAYRPTNTFSVDALSTALPEGTRLHSPRPLSYLTGLRDVSGDPVSARDHAIFETLVAVALERDPLLRHPVHAVPIDAVVNVIRTGKPLTRRSQVMQSLDRLLSAEFTLPSIATRDDVPLLRLHTERRERIAIASARIMSSFRRSEKKLVRSIRTLGDEAQQEAADTELINLREQIAEWEADLKVFSRANERDCSEGMSSQLDKILRVLERKVPVELSDDLLQSDGLPEIAPNARRRLTQAFHPLTRYGIVGDGIILFALAPYARHFLREVVHQGERLYGRVDLTAMASFSSRFVSTLHREAVAALGGRVTPRERFEGYDRAQATTIEDLADRVGMPIQRGGRGGQIKRAVLERARSEMSGRVVLDYAIRGEKIDLVFYSAPETDLRAIRTTGVFTEIRQHGEIKYKRLPLDQIAEFGHVDVPGRKVPAGVFLKAASVCGLRGHEMRFFAMAFGVALDETDHLGDPVWGDHTGRGAGRRCRGQALLDLIEREGILRAAIYFCIEETERPDLTREGVLSAMRMDRSWYVIEADRKGRLLARKRGVEYVPPQRTTSVERDWSGVQTWEGRIAPHIADLDARRAAAKERRAAAAKLKRSERDRERNAKRREARQKVQAVFGSALSSTAG